MTLQGTLPLCGDSSVEDGWRLVRDRVVLFLAPCAILRQQATGQANQEYPGIGTQQNVPSDILLLHAVMDF